MTTVVTKIEKEEEAARPESKDMCEEGAEEENSTTALGEYWLINRVGLSC